MSFFLYACLTAQIPKKATTERQFSNLVEKYPNVLSTTDERDSKDEPEPILRFTAEEKSPIWFSCFSLCIK